MSVERNRPCPCGSGKKFKHCCQKKDTSSGSRLTLVFVLGILVLFAGALVVAFTNVGRAPSDAGTPEDWYYDARNDQHWDPNHDHWHKGLPPLDGVSPPPEKPEPWQYDASGDRHWDPGHGHWHEGRPPTQPTGQAPPPVAEPEPWEYEEAADRHWDPERKQWRDGLPVSE